MLFVILPPNVTLPLKLTCTANCCPAIGLATLAQTFATPLTTWPNATTLPLVMSWINMSPVTDPTKTEASTRRALGGVDESVRTPVVVFNID